MLTGMLGRSRLMGRFCIRGRVLGRRWNSWCVGKWVWVQLRGFWVRAGHRVSGGALSEDNVSWCCRRVNVKHVKIDICRD